MTLSFKVVFDYAAKEITSVACRYFVQNGLLFRKWLTLGTDCVGDAVVQLVVPTKFRPCLKSR